MEIIKKILRNKLCLISFLSIFLLLVYYNKIFVNLYKYERHLNFIYGKSEGVREAFVTYGTSSHIGLMEVLVKSVHRFSSRPIIVYCIDCRFELNNTYNRLINRTFEFSKCGGNIYYCKPLILLDSNVLFGVYLDADSVVNYNVDILFEVIRSWNGSHPLSPVHPADPNNQNFYMNMFKVDTKSLLYVHAASVLWNNQNQHREFFKEWFRISKKINGANYDETALNIALWKSNAKHSVCLYDSYAGFHHDYLMDKFNPIPGIPYIYLVFHGGKASKSSDELLKRISNTSDHKNIKLINSQCCPTQAKPSSYHKLICNYQ